MKERFTSSNKLGLEQFKIHIIKKRAKSLREINSFLGRPEAEIDMDHLYECFKVLLQSEQTLDLLENNFQYL